MAITITGKLNQSANKFQAGESQGFGVRLGVRYYDRETKAQEWTNYEAVIFAKPGKQSEFYSSTLVEGSIIEIAGSGCQIKTWESTKGPVNSIAILDAKLGYVSNNDAPRSIEAPQKQQPQQQQPSDQPFDDDIPF
jgi:hypothetical protein|tara:strand:- start:355 stop:762 length:408 start_codon:yes stop_codon:yes gene_type:complete